MSIKITAGAGGFKYGEFTDRYGIECRIQESTLAEEACVWLGRVHEPLDPTTNQPFGAMMHLTQDMAKELIPLLETFVETDFLGYPKWWPRR